MSWIMEAKIVDMEQVTVYAATKEYTHFVKILYKWEAI
ncbi:hypothetical protein EF36P1_00035 [Enterococcus phage EF36P1]|jgi:hypothetical protein|nr:hypothetical protein EF36P1_00035 [Enterococcus phage EF36P1]WAX14904.1 hypothetical protein EF36P2_00027 [Enterococcus phage EF36P2]WAX14976.1 hypothetical protein EF36P3_00037 [Enterococcus phage EF36P3]DAT36879.1 MAG TPA: hypothetical protein [Caudoviricetes sp.]